MTGRVFFLSRKYAHGVCWTLNQKTLKTFKNLKPNFLNPRFILALDATDTQPVPVEQTKTLMFFETGACNDVTSSIHPTNSDRASSLATPTLLATSPSVT